MQIYNIFEENKIFTQKIIIFAAKKEHLEDVLDMVRNSKLFNKIEKSRFFYD